MIVLIDSKSKSPIAQFEPLEKLNSNIRIQSQISQISSNASVVYLKPADDFFCHFARAQQQNIKKSVNNLKNDVCFDKFNESEMFW